MESTWCSRIADAERMRIGCQRLPWEFNYSNGTMATAPVMKGPSPRGHRITWYLQYISRMVVGDGWIPAILPFNFIHPVSSPLPRRGQLQSVLLSSGVDEYNSVKIKIVKSIDYLELIRVCLNLNCCSRIQSPDTL